MVFSRVVNARVTVCAQVGDRIVMNAVVRGYIGTLDSAASLFIHEYNAIPAADGDFDRITVDLNVRGSLEQNLCIPQAAGRYIAIALHDIVAYHRVVADFMLNSLAQVVDDGVAVENGPDTISVIPKAGSLIIVNVVGLHKEICCPPELRPTGIIIYRKASVIVPGKLVLDHTAVDRTAIQSLLAIVMSEGIQYLRVRANFDSVTMVPPRLDMIDHPAGPGFVCADCPKVSRCRIFLDDEIGQVDSSSAAQECEWLHA
jgi:hypothetical protein